MLKIIVAAAFDQGNTVCTSTFIFVVVIVFCFFVVVSLLFLPMAIKFIPSLAFTWFEYLFLWGGMALEFLRNFSPKY